METIKRYENRKLYSTLISKYVKLEYINDLVKSGSKFEVIDNKSKKDITRSTMKQSVMLLDLPKSTLAMLIKGA